MTAASQPGITQRTVLLQALCLLTVYKASHTQRHLHMNMSCGTHPMHTIASIDVKKGRGFPGGSVVKNLPASAGDTGSSPGPGRSHMPRGIWTHAPHGLSLCSGAPERQHPSPSAAATEARTFESEKHLCHTLLGSALAPP